MAPVAGTPTTAFVNAAQSPTAIIIDRPSGLVDVGGLALVDTVLVANVGGRRTTTAITLWTLPGAEWELTPITVGVLSSARDPMIVSYAVYLAGEAIPATFTYTADGGVIDLGAVVTPVTGVSTLTPLDSNGSVLTAGSSNALVFDGFDTTTDETLVLLFAEQERDAVLTYAAPADLLATVVTTNATVGDRATISMAQTAGPATVGTVADQSASSSQTRNWATGMIALSPAGIVANAGPDQDAEAGEYITLDGSGSVLATTYDWVQVAGTPTVILDDATPPDGIAHFNAPRLADGAADVSLVFELTVGDGVDTAVDQCTVTLHAPPVTPGIPRFVRFGAAWYPAGGGPPV